MTSIPCLSGSLQTLFTETADRLGRESGLVKRARTLSGSVFALTLVFGFLDSATATLRQLQQLAATAGVRVSQQAIAQRCSEEAATFLQQMLETAVQTLVCGAPSASALLQRFPAVVVMDSTTITLPAVLRSVWRGCGGSTLLAAAAVLKVQLRLDLCRGAIDVFALSDGKASDQKARSQTAPLPRGAVRLSDQGFFSMAVFRAVVAAGAHFLSRPVPGLSVQVGDAARCSLARFLEGCRGELVDLPVLLGSKETLACRLIAVRAPTVVAELRRGKERAAAQREGRAVRETVLRLAAWTLVVTSLAPSQLTPSEALVLLRLRWQVERVFKRWKSAGGKVEEWRTAKPGQALCTVYAKLLACLVAQWLTAVSCWDLADKSLDAALQTVQAWATTLLLALCQSRRQLATSLRLLGAVLCHSCRLQKRKGRPASFQLLHDPSLQPLN